MTREEIENRIEAIEYILENDLYNNDYIDDIYDELDGLRAQMDSLKGSNDEDEGESILEQRKAQYGNYSTFVAAMKNILNILTSRKGSCNYDEEDIENFFFVLKLLRLQTASDLDSVFDLHGYAKLAYERRSNKT